MYFFSLKPLKNDLAGPGLPEKERMKYLLAWMLAFTSAPLFATREAGTIEVATAIIVLLLTLFGVLLAWKRNGGAEGRAFTDRFLSIGWVISLRILVFLLSVNIFIGVLLTGLGYGDAIEQWEPVLASLFMIGAETYFAFTIARHVGEVRQVADASTSEPSPAQTAERLEKFVETVVKREMASAVVAKARKPARKSTIRPLKSARTRRK